jgi:hypothetical protein
MPRSEITLTALAQAYFITRQGLHQLMERNHLTRQDIMEPERVFQALLSNKASHLRARLTDPRNRAKIAKKLAALSA